MSSPATPLRFCRFQVPDAAPCVGILGDGGITDLTPVGVTTLTQLIEAGDDGRRWIDAKEVGALPQRALSEVRLLPPVERQEVWAAGVTYLRSKTARMEESDFSARAYNHVYDAPRPEIFFKSMPEKVSGPGEPVGIRSDARWNVPEPELALVLDARGRVAGFTIGNDMSSRDIEGENLLYLPQAKIYERSCALGPCVVLGVGEDEARSWAVRVEILRAGVEMFSGETSVSRIKRGFGELADWLFRSQRFPHGAILLTGTGVVPPNEFTLEASDRVRIGISGIGVLENEVVRV